MKAIKLPKFVQIKLFLSFKRVLRTVFKKMQTLWRNSRNAIGYLNILTF